MSLRIKLYPPIPDKEKHLLFGNTIQENRVDRLETDVKRGKLCGKFRNYLSQIAFISHVF